MTLQSKYIYFISANFLKRISLFLPSQLFLYESPFFFFGHLPYNLAVCDTHFIGLEHHKVSKRHIQDFVVGEPKFHERRYLPEHGVPTDYFGLAAIFCKLFAN